MSINQMITILENTSGSDGEGEQEVDPLAVKYFVGVRPAVMPDNRFLQYATVDRLLEVSNLPARTVIVFGSDDHQVRMATVLSRHMREMGVALTFLDGIPGSDLTPELKDAFFGLPVASHSAFISEMALDTELEDQRRATSTRRIDQEEQRSRRSDGSVKKVEIGVYSDEDEQP